MNRATWLQGRRMLKFRDVLTRWERRDLSMMEAGSCWECRSGSSGDTGSGLRRKRTPKDIVWRAQCRHREALADPTVRSRLAELGQELFRAISRPLRQSAHCTRPRLRNGGRSSRQPTSGENELSHCTICHSSKPVNLRTSIKSPVCPLTTDIRRSSGCPTAMLRSAAPSPHSRGS
jgi:hypothetical protein